VRVLERRQITRDHRLPLQREQGLELAQGALARSGCRLPRGACAHRAAGATPSWHYTSEPTRTPTFDAQGNFLGYDLDWSSATLSLDGIPDAYTRAPGDYLYQIIQMETDRDGSMFSVYKASGWAFRDLAISAVKLTASQQAEQTATAAMAWLDGAVLADNLRAAGLPTLYFGNRTLDLVGTETGGTLAVSFPVNGSTEDNAAYFTAVATTGESDGRTLAQLLSRNVAVATDATDLVEDFNPLAFAIRNFWRYGALVVRLNTTAASTGAPWAAMLTRFRQLIPAQLIVIMQLVSDADPDDYSISWYETEDAYDSAFASDSWRSWSETVTATIVEGAVA
jgi:hypothetical protein